MLAIPSALQSKFEERLRNESISNNLKGQYKKWLQYKEVAPPPFQMGLGYMASWRAEYSRLADEIHLRHYS